MKIVTSLSFQGQCREAFEFYAKVLGGTIKAAMPYGDAPPGMPITDEKYKTWLMHCWLDVGDQALMGADMDVGWASNIDKPKNGFDVTLHTNDMAEARRWFDQHAVRRNLLVARLRHADRQVRHPLDDQRYSIG
jgi:PhnB protein